jgi:SecD/SecF fusion protein
MAVGDAFDPWKRVRFPMSQFVSFVTNDWYWVAFLIVTAAMIGYGMWTRVTNLYWKVVVCLVPILLSIVIVGQATARYNAGRGGFKLGVDLVGGTILVYEIDPDRKMQEGYKPEQLAAALKRRIDPNDLYNVTIRPVSDSRVEIILPTGGARQANRAQEEWKKVLEQVNDHFKDKLGGERVDVNRGQITELADRITTKIESNEWAKMLNEVPQKFPKIKDAKDVKLNTIKPGLKEQLAKTIEQATGDKLVDIEAFINEHFLPEKYDVVEKYIESVAGGGQQRVDVTGEEVEKIKAKIRQVGSLEFRILANKVDDRDVIEAVEKYFNQPASPELLKEELANAARNGQVPPFPDRTSTWGTTREDLGNYSYAWVELGRQERESMGLSNRYEETGSGSFWAKVAEAREKNQVVEANGQTLIYSRKCQNPKLPPREVELKKYEYFILTRLPEVDPDNPSEHMAVTGRDLTDAKPTEDDRGDLAVGFSFNSHGSRMMQNLTSKNLPSQQGSFGRLLAVILDDMVESAATVQQTISSSGIIHGSFTKEKVDGLVSVLRSGALPATLKPLPVSENTIGPTLGQETIDRGVNAVGLAFLAVLVFMLIYYRFAGFVACVALLANLLLTIAFMVFVNATFTLPGLAGLVLTLGMAVDANVLIYERLREERDKGANLLLALRNGYDRALPTIIDTHLTSIFTAIVLYVVGNDQLKGFGVSLAAGLIVSLFTSLFVTRTLFDLWIKLGLLKKLSMFRFLTKPNIDFMRIRYYWFTATILLTIFGLSVFMIRGPQGLNIDFVGGTALGGQLKQPLGITELRQLLGDNETRRKSVLDINKVAQTDEEGRNFVIYYADGQEQKVSLANKAAGDSKAAREQNVKDRASALPDWSVEQIFLSSEPNAEGKSRFFTVRTTEKEPDLVLVTVNRLLRDDATGQPLMKQVLLTDYSMKDRHVELDFSDYASPGFVKTLLDRELRDLKSQHPDASLPDSAPDPHGIGEQQEGRFKKLGIDFDATTYAAIGPQRLKQVLERTQKEFGDRPQPERLENFDAQLATDTQTKAFEAIIASWAAILLYLWLRFGSWTFGAAAVLCLIHDLFFTIGIIAFCHYITVWMPGVASVLRIEDFKIDLPSVAALLTLVGYSVSDTIVVFDRIREVRGKNPLLTPQMINDSVNQTLSRTLLASTTVWLVVFVLFAAGGEGVHLFAFVMVVGVIVGTYSSIYIASPLLLIFGEGQPKKKLNVPSAPAVSGV